MVLVGSGVGVIGISGLIAFFLDSEEFGGCAGTIGGGGWGVGVFGAAG